MRKLAGGLLALVGVTVLVFSLAHLVPGDPIDTLLGEQANPAERLALRRCLDLDQSVPVQLGRFVAHIFDGTLGTVCPDRTRTVASLIGEAYPHTLFLALVAVLLALAIALPLGIVAALGHGSWVDSLVSVIALLGVSVPTLWLGPALLALFYVKLQWFPGPADETTVASVVLPAIMLGTHLMAMLMRMTRTSFVQVLGRDFIRTARSKGLSTFQVVVRHGLRNALIPVVSVAALQFGALVAGAVITEKIFARPGIGTLLLEAIFSRNYRIIQGCTLVIAASYVLINLLTDVVYVLIDPRMREAERSSS